MVRKNNEINIEFSQQELFPLHSNSGVNCIQYQLFKILQGMPVTFEKNLDNLSLFQSKVSYAKFPHIHT